MIRVFPFVMFSFMGFAQSYAPEPGAAGSTAIHKDSSVIAFWADDAVVTRGPLDIQNVALGFASYGVDANAIGPADGASFVSLGDGGEVVLTFPFPISDDIGPDFCVFENGFADHYMELAFVEVSSDGINYFRFDAISEIPLDTQVSNFTTTNCAYIHNLAGKYRVGYGTPFDLSELSGETGLDIQNVTHVKLIDCIGIINPTYASLDSQGGIINDPYPTDFPEGGFDLDGVGVINSAYLELGHISNDWSVYPNPFNIQFSIKATGEHNYQLVDLLGRVLKSGTFVNSMNVSTENLREGNYLLLIDGMRKTIIKR